MTDKKLAEAIRLQREGWYLENTMPAIQAYFRAGGFEYTPDGVHCAEPRKGANPHKQASNRATDGGKDVDGKRTDIYCAAETPMVGTLVILNRAAAHLGKAQRATLGIIGDRVREPKFTKAALDWAAGVVKNAGPFPEQAARAKGKGSGSKPQVVEFVFPDGSTAKWSGSDASKLVAAILNGTVRVSDASRAQYAAPAADKAAGEADKARKAA